MTCREYILPRDASDPKGWIRGNTKIGPVLEVTTSYLQGKYGVEIRIESVNKDRSHSCVRIDGEPTEFEWNIFPGFNTLQLSQEVQELLLRLNETPENFHRKDHIHVDVQRHLMGIKRQQDRMRVKCSTRFSICKKIWSRTVVISRSWFREKRGIIPVKIVHKVKGTKWQKR